MTSSAARMGNSSIGPGQMQECASQQTVATEDMSVSVGQYDRPEKAQHAQHDSGSIGEGTVVENSPMTMLRVELPSNQQSSHLCMRGSRSQQCRHPPWRPSLAQRQAMAGHRTHQTRIQAWSSWIQGPWGQQLRGVSKIQMALQQSLRPMLLSQQQPQSAHAWLQSRYLAAICMLLSVIVVSLAVYLAHPRRGKNESHSSTTSTTLNKVGVPAFPPGCERVSLAMKPCMRLGSVRESRSWCSGARC